MCTADIVQTFVNFQFYTAVTELSYNLCTEFLLYGVDSSKHFMMVILCDTWL